MSEGEIGVAQLPTGAGRLAAAAIPSNPPDGLPGRRRLWAIFSLSAGTLLLTLDSSIANVGLPTIAHDLHVASSDSVLLVSVYNLVLAMTLMPLATLGIHIGLRRLFMTGLAAYILGSFLSWFANSLDALLAVRAIQSLGAAAAISVGSALVRTTYPRAQLGRGLGFNILAASTGAALAPVIGGLIVSHASWHFVFVIGVPFAIISMIAGRALPDPERAGRRFDTIGAVFCAAAFGLLIFGLHFVTGGHSAFLPAGLILSGVAAGCVLVWYETTHPHPVLPVDLLRQPALALSVSAGLCTYLASTSLLLALPFRLHAAGFSPARIGEAILPYALVATVFAPASGAMADRISPARLGIVGLITAFIAMVLLACLPHLPTLWQAQVPMGLCGMGFGLFMAPNGRLIIGAVIPERAASASSLLSTTRMMSQAVASTFVGALLALGVWPATPVAAACLVALALCFTLVQTRTRPRVGAQ